MVFTHNSILNGYNNFLVYDSIMPNMNYYKLCYTKNSRTLGRLVGYDLIHEHNEDYKPAPPEFVDFFKVVENFDVDSKKYKMRNEFFVETFGMKKINDYLGIEPFNDSLMLNISPKWSEGVEGVPEATKISLLKIVIKKFITDSGRFSRNKFVIECGKSGDHIHAHCVLELNPELKKSNKTWISKHNHIRDFRNIWKKMAVDLESNECVASKYAIQSVLIKNRTMLQDKLDYLVEELKPLSHKNADHPHLPQVFGDWS